MEFSRPEYFSVLPFPSPGELPNPGIESACPGFFTGTEPPGKPLNPYNLSDLDPVLQSKKLREVEAVAQAHTARIPALVGQLIRHPSPGSFVTDPKNTSLGHCEASLGQNGQLGTYHPAASGAVPFFLFLLSGNASYQS